MQNGDSISLLGCMLQVTRASNIEGQSFAAPLDNQSIGHMDACQQSNRFFIRDSSATSPVMVLSLKDFLGTEFKEMVFTMQDLLKRWSKIVKNKQALTIQDS